jgi:Ku70/Ku80 beta-barrel domain
MLKQFSDRDFGVLVDASDALEMTKEFKKKSVRQTPVFKGNLTLGDPKSDNHLSIPIQMIKKVSPLTLPSAKKMSGIVDKKSPDNGLTVESRYKISQKDKTAEPVYVNRENATKAYRFGKIFVPFTEADEEESKFVGAESFSILNFCPSSNVSFYHVYCFLDSSTIVS